MDLFELVRIVLRRWYVAVPVLVIGLFAAFYLYQQVPPQYQARGSVLLSTPDLNPQQLAETGLGVSGAIDVIAQAVQAQGSGADNLTIFRAPDGALEITARADSAAQAETLALDAVDRAREALDDLQARLDVPQTEQFRIRQLTAAPDIQDTADGAAVATIALAVEPAVQRSNPYGADGRTGRLLQVAIESDRGRILFREQAGPGVDFVVTQAARDAAAIMEITTFGSEPQRVLAGFDDVVIVLEEILQERQDRAGAPLAQRVTLEVIAEPLSVTDISPPFNRGVAALLALTGVAALAMAISAEAIIVALRRRRGTTTHTNGPADDPPFGQDKYSSLEFEQRLGSTTPTDATVTTPDRAP